MTSRTGARIALLRAREPASDGGRAVIEVLLLAVLLMIPVTYIMIGVLRLQSATMAVAQAARDVGRLIETSSGTPTIGEATVLAETALLDQNISAAAMQIRTVPTGADCRQAAQAAVSRKAGATYDVCVIAVVTLPGVPTIVAGTDNTVTGVYTVHIGELKEGP